MPRHIRSITARRPRKIARHVRDVPVSEPTAAEAAPALLSPIEAPAASTPAAAAPTPAARAAAAAAPVAPVAPAPAVTASATSARQVELFENLRRAFQPDPDGPDTPERTRDRYVWAIESMAEYLEAIGADALWVQRIDELGWALEDLTNGQVPPLLQPNRLAR